jgi:asparagine synthase (glutamine-hydrolysing)
MCGIAGLVDFKNKNVEKKILEKMVSIQSHRGPDDKGFYYGENVALGHSRLAIIDLSRKAHQPMPNEDNTKWIIHNGEIYNYLELRDELLALGHNFRSVSDTEVALHAFEEWGVDALNRFNGMWAFAIWDSVRSELFASRDRFGIKPFYYHFDRASFTFASEIKALFQNPRIEKKPNSQAIYDYIISGYGYMDIADYTFFGDIYQIKPAHYIKVNVRDKTFVQKKYWDLDGISGTPKKSEEAYLGEFNRLFEDAVRLRLRSDVRVGVSLSGGLDSSSVASVASKFHGGALASFSSCFEDKDSDERQYINDILKSTPLKAHFISANPTNLFSEIENIIWHQEEPYSTLSIFPQWHVMKLARQSGVKVLLTGQAGDETLAGYHKYYLYLFADLFKALKWKKAFREIRMYKKIKGPGATVSGNVLKIILSDLVPGPLKKARNRFFKRIPAYINKDFAKNHGPRAHTERKFSSILNNDLYNAFKMSPLPSLLHIDDRSSMAHSVESRSPFLDYRLVEYAFSVPPEYKIKDGRTKFILRKAMQGRLPESVTERRDKMGFPTPLESWLKGPLRSGVTDILNSREFNRRPYLNPGSAGREFELFLKGDKDKALTVWSWLNLELWFRKYID